MALVKPENARAFTVSGAEIISEENGFVFIKKAFRAGDVIEIRFDFALAVVPARDEMQENAKTILWGNLYLGTETEKDLPCPDVEKMTLSGAEKAAFTDENGREYAPLGHLTFETEEKIQNSRIQMIF